MNTQFFSRSIRAISISTLICGVALLTGCDKKEVEALTNNNKELSEKLNQLEIQAKTRNDLYTKLQESDTAKDNLIKALNANIKEKESLIQSLNVTISEKEKAASISKINKQKEDIQFWNDTVSQISDIVRQMMQYETVAMSSLFIAGGKEATLDEAQKAKQNYLNFSKEAKSLAYKLPENESRKELMKTIDSIEFNLTSHVLYDAFWTSFHFLKGENDKNTKDSKEKYKSFREVAFNNSLKINAFKISQ